VAKVQTIFQ